MVAVAILTLATIGTLGMRWAFILWAYGRRRQLCDMGSPAEARGGFEDMRVLALAFTAVEPFQRRYPYF